jgi:hydrogenase maturation protease
MSKRPAWKARLARELGRPEKLAVLGVGNLGKGDDGAGVRAAEGLLRRTGRTGRPGLAVFIAHEVPENFTGPVRRSGASVALVIDAAAAGHDPGTIFLVDPAAIPAEEVSSHRTPLSTLASYLTRTAKCRVVILGIEPRGFVEGAGLSGPVREAVKEVIRWLADYISGRVRSSSASERKCS